MELFHAFLGLGVKPARTDIVVVVAVAVGVVDAGKFDCFVVVGFVFVVVVELVGFVVVVGLAVETVGAVFVVVPHKQYLGTDTVSR